MPLKNGSSRRTIGSNITKLVHAWEKDGAIGTSHPANKKKAVKQAVAIALKKSGTSTSTHSQDANRKRGVKHPVSKK